MSCSLFAICEQRTWHWPDIIRVGKGEKFKEVLKQLQEIIL
jgi:hypothetical protein